jgi:Protein of unknown function (DUF2961)
MADPVPAAGRSVRSLRLASTRFRVKPQITRVLVVASLTFAYVRSTVTQEQTPKQVDLAAARSYYLSDLITLPSYSPGKNSFLIRNLSRGDRKTLLHLGGSGSVRHIWSTWSAPGDNTDNPPPGRVLIRVFLDGEAKPAIAGALDELCRAAEASGTRFVPLPAFNYKGAFNLYLPIYFTRGIRIELEAADAIEEFYTQIDYRLDSRPRRTSRLISEKKGGELALNYVGGLASIPMAETPSRSFKRLEQNLEYGPRMDAEVTLNGPGILRELTFRGPSLADLELQIYWDDEATPSVDAPLRYFFADFVNVALESKPSVSTCHFPMPFNRKARIVIRSLTGQADHVGLEYALEPAPVPARALYFHAQYRETEMTVGYAPYCVLRVRGEGLFVGVNLFDSGHNHGGGDSALIDAGTAEPRVLHGICGEDYFGFAWHRTGAMTLLTGAPVHERRYRLHLENPYPFRESFQFTFGVFAGQHPKSVAFWYQLHEPVHQGPWAALDIPWKILGPFGLDTFLPDAVTDQEHPTVTPIKESTKLAERWQDADMQSGFLDATYQFRHYAMIESGTGFVAGAGKTRMISYVYSPATRSLNAILGHDDRVLVRLNHAAPAEIPRRSGFGRRVLSLKLRAGWNTLDLVVHNDENVNWRWCGISLAFERKASQDLRFTSKPPANANLE